MSPNHPESTIFLDLLNLGAKITLDAFGKNSPGLKMSTNKEGKTLVRLDWLKLGEQHPDKRFSVGVVSLTVLTSGSDRDSESFYLYPGTYEFIFNWRAGATEGGKMLKVDVLKKEFQGIEIDETWV